MKEVFFPDKEVKTMPLFGGRGTGSGDSMRPAAQELEDNYHFDAELCVWIREGYKGLNYADGSEASLLPAMKEIGDRSVFSPEIAALQKGWAKTYHLSRYRANLLRPFENRLLAGKRVLELGCGCGAITRYLGECGALVCAVEGARARGAIAALRCQDLANVSVIVDRIQDLPDTLGKFDAVTLIGVLEYAQSFGLGQLAMLKRAASFLKEDGTLILALENRLGLKYFAGVPEDHLGMAWAGVTGGYRGDGVVTFSRMELLSLLREAGFAQCEQFVPLPDYKLPRTIICQEALDNPGLINLKAILSQAGRAHEVEPLFNLAAAWGGIVDAGLLSELADSLCFIASKTRARAEGKGLLAQHFGNAIHSNKKYAKVMSIVKDGELVSVIRSRLFPDQDNKAGAYEQVLENEPYYKGERLIDRIRHCVVCPRWTVAELAGTFRPWVDALVRIQSPEGLIPGEYMDFTPFNIIVNSEGTLQPFDQEWRKNGQVALDYILARGIILSLMELGPVAAPAKDTGLSYGVLLDSILSELSLSIDWEKLQKTWDEDNFEKNLGFPVPPFEQIKQARIKVALESAANIWQLEDACGILGVPMRLMPEQLASARQKIVELRARMLSMHEFIKKLLGKKETGRK